MRCMKRISYMGSNLHCFKKLNFLFFNTLTTIGLLRVLIIIIIISCLHHLCDQHIIF